MLHVHFVYSNLYWSFTLYEQIFNMRAFSTRSNNCCVEKRYITHHQRFIRHDVCKLSFVIRRCRLSAVQAARGHYESWAAEYWKWSLPFLGTSKRARNLHTYLNNVYRIDLRSNNDYFATHLLLIEPRHCIYKQETLVLVTNCFHPTNCCTWNGMNCDAITNV